MSSSISFHPRSSNEPENLVLSLNMSSQILLDWPAPCVSPTPLLGLQVNAINPDCVCGFWRTKAGTLPTKLSFQPCNLRLLFSYVLPINF